MPCFSLKQVNNEQGPLAAATHAYTNRLRSLLYPDFHIKYTGKDEA